LLSPQLGFNRDIQVRASAFAAERRASA